MSLGNVTLEQAALDAIEADDLGLAAELVDQLTPDEAQIVFNAANTLAAMAHRVAMEPLPGVRRHLRAV